MAKTSLVSRAPCFICQMQLELTDWQGDVMYQKKADWQTSRETA